MKVHHHGFSLLVLSAAVSQAIYADGVAVNDSYATTNSSSGYVFNVLANDSDSDDDPPVLNADTLSVASYDDSSIYGGELSFDQATQEFTYVPSADFDGTDFFTYFVQDETGYGNQATVSIAVSAASSPTDEGPIESQVTGESNKTTARMLEDICDPAYSGSLTPELIAACNAIDPDDPNINDLVSEITPEEILMQRRMMSEVNRGQMSRVYSSQQMLRNGAGVGTSGSDTVLLNSYLGGTAGDGAASPWAIFGTVKFGETEHDKTSKESAYDANMYGVMVGLNYRLRPDIDVGAAFDVVTYDVDYDSNAGELESDIYTLTGFGSWYREQVGVDVLAGYSTGDISTQRNMTIPISAVINGDTDTEMYFLSAQVQYTVTTAGWTNRPYLRLDYISAQVDGYTETGTSPWLMNVGKQDLDQINASLGVDTTYALSFDWGVWVPGTVFSVVSEASSDYAPVAFNLVGDSGSQSQFELQPDSEDSLFYQIDFNSVFVLKNGFSTFISAQFITGYDNISSYQLQGGVNWEL